MMPEIIIIIISIYEQNSFTSTNYYEYLKSVPVIKTPLLNLLKSNSCQHCTVNFECKILH